MSWLRRKDPDFEDDRTLSAVLGVRELPPERERPRIEFAPKPPDLERVFDSTVPSSTRPGPAWSDDAPTQEGLYWWRARDLLRPLPPKLDVVVDFGGRLCVRQTWADGARYVAVSMLARQWAGPLSLPPGVTVADLT